MERKKGWQTNININIYLAHKQIPFVGLQWRFFYCATFRQLDLEAPWHV